MGMEPRATMIWQLPLELSTRIREYAVEVARLNGATPDEADDVAQATIIALNDAATRNPSVGDLLLADGWRGYVATATRNALAGYKRSEGRRAQREESEARQRSALGTGSDELEELDAHLLLEDLSAYLTREEQLFIHLRYFVGLPMREIAQELGTTQGRISHLGRAAIRKIERVLLAD